MKTVMSIRFPVEQHQAIIKAAETQAAGNPAELVRKAVSKYLEELNGGGLEARISARLDALAAAIPAGVADEIEARKRAALAAKQAREAARAGGQ